MSTWVLLRGLTRESRHWGAFPQTLARQWPAARILTPDLPGNGRLYRLQSPSTVEAMAADCRARLLAQGERPPFHVLAMSLGAMVAVAWANAQPDEIAAGVLINTSLRPFSPFHQRLRPGNYAALLGLMLRRHETQVQEVRAREALVLAITSRMCVDAAAVLDDWVAYRRECPVSRANALRQLLAAARYRAPPQRPAAPILVLAGAQDRLVDPRCSERLAQQWSAPVALHPSAGHDLPLDDGPWVAAQAREWMPA